MKFFWLVVILAASTLSTGCMQMHMDTVIEDDGSGTSTVKFSVGREVADALAKLSDIDPAAMGSGESMPDLGNLREADVKAACKEAGVELVSHEYVDDANGQRLTMTIAFRDVADLSRALNGIDADSGSQDQRLFIEAVEGGNFALRSESAPRADDAEEETGSGDAPDTQDMAKMQDAMQSFGVLMSHMNEMDVRMAVTVPGDVISSNAPKVEGRTSIWAVDASNMMQAQDMDMDPEIVFSGKGLKLRPSRR
jgi:hypothetical protein